MNDRAVARWLLVGAACAVGVVVWASHRIEQRRSVHVEDVAPAPKAPPPPVPRHPPPAPEAPVLDDAPICGSDEDVETGSILRTLNLRVLARAADRSAALQRSPVPGASVVLTDDDGARRFATTDSEGRARIDGPLVLSRGVLEISAPGFATDVRSRTWWTSEVVTVELQPRVSIEGVVREPDGSPIPGARFDHVAGFARGPKGTERTLRTVATSAADGTFRLADVPSDSGLDLLVTAPHHVTRSLYARSAEGPIDVRLWPTGVLRGSVVDPDAFRSGGATVIARLAGVASRTDDDIRPYYEATTDARGEFVMDGLPFGEWAVRATRRGSADSVEMEGVVVDDARRDVSVSLALRRFARVDVTVTDERGVIVGDAEISCRTDSVVKRARSDASGHAAFEVMQPGTILVSAESPSLRPTQIDVEIAPGETKAVYVRLETGAIVSGLVVDDLGRALPSATVSVESRGRDAGKRSTVSCGADGSFRISGLDDDRYLLVIGCDRFARFEQTLTAPNEGLRVVLARTGHVSLRIAAPPGATFPGMYRVSFIRAAARARTSIAACWSDRSAETDLEPGRWRVVAQARGFAAAARDFDVRPGEGAALGDIVLDGGVTVEGRVVDAQGVPVAGAFVEARADTVQETGATDAEGRFRIEHVAPGATVLGVHFEGADRGTKDVDVGAGGARGVEIVVAR